MSLFQATMELSDSDNFLNGISVILIKKYTPDRTYSNIFDLKVSAIYYLIK